MKVLAQRVDGLEKAQMRDLVDQLRGKLGSGVVVAWGCGGWEGFFDCWRDEGPYFTGAGGQGSWVAWRLRLVGRVVGGRIWLRLVGVMWVRSTRRCRVRQE